MQDTPSRWILESAYDRSAKGYDRRFAELQAVKYDAVLARLELPGSGRLLDAGCGTGLLAPRLAPGRRVVGLDLSRGMLLEAGGRLEARVQGDVLALPFPDRSFAVVFAVTAFLVPPSFFPRALAEAARVLEPGGALAVTLLKNDVSEGFADAIGAAGLTPGERFEAGQDWGWIARRGA